MPTFKVQGQIYHKVGSLLPITDVYPQFLKIYFMGDAATEANHKCSGVPSTRLHTATDLQQFLDANNAYIRLF
jgi:hypothetical protein